MKTWQILWHFQSSLCFTEGAVEILYVMYVLSVHVPHGMKQHPLWHFLWHFLLLHFQVCIPNYMLI